MEVLEKWLKEFNVSDLTSVFNLFISSSLDLFSPLIGFYTEDWKTTAELIALVKSTEEGKLKTLWYVPALSVSNICFLGLMTTEMKLVLEK